MNNTSATFTVWRTLLRLMNEAQFPKMVDNDTGVVVYFGEPDTPPLAIGPSNEKVVVVSTVGQVDESWGPSGNSAREERFSVFIAVVSAVPGRTELQAMDRVEELTSVIEGVFRTVNLKIGQASTPHEFDVYPYWAIEKKQMVPTINVTTEGIIGRAEFTMQCEFRIGTPAVTA